MSGLDEMRSIASASRNGVPCWIQSKTGGLTPADAETLRQALVDETIMSSTISTWLERRGVRVGAQSIARHRRGICRCDRG